MARLQSRRPHRAWMIFLGIPLVMGGLLVGAADGKGLRSLLSLDLPGTYTGWMSVEGNDLQATVTLTLQGDTLGVRMSVPDLGSVVQGSGVVDAEGFSFQVPYDLGCPGQATFRGEQDNESRVLSGSVQAADCNGTMSGSFRFSPSADDQ